MTDSPDSPKIIEDEGRPAVPLPGRRSLRAPLLTGALLAVVVYWLLIPLWPDLGSRLLGDPDTDAIRGMWGFDHIRRSLLPPDTPIWSSEINFPSGVTVMVLPWVTSILLAPVGLLFGPLIGWNLNLAILLWAVGMATAALVRVCTDSWTAGAAAGAAMVCQPMLLHAISDGTPEHLAIWAMPLFLAAALMALRSTAPSWGILAGVLAAVVALDSPYHAIYTAVAGIIVLPWAISRPDTPARRTQLWWTIGTMVLCIGLAGLAIGLLYTSFPISEQVGYDQTALLQMNATDLRTWWQYDFQTTAVRDASLAPTTIPAPILWGALIFILAGVPRSLPWMVAGLTMVVLSLGLNPRIPTHLTHWIGPSGVSVGSTLLNLNTTLYSLPGIGEIRFPQRWLVPGSMTLLVGAGYGVARLHRLLRPVGPPLVLLVAAGSAFFGVRSSHIDLGFPAQHLPEVEFANWIAEQPEQGALITLPQMRPPPESGKRGDLPVFANLADSLSSSDVLYFQVIHRQAVVGYPSIKTIAANTPSEAIIALFRDWDDLAHPGVTGKSIPESAHDVRSDQQRQFAIRELYDLGMRWVVFDEGAYLEEAQGILRTQLDGWIGHEEHFEEGDGITVFRLRDRNEP
ncbi:MAG: hypothetical protein P8R54_29800 [Myxococcota bacterium]|nr:hypothetical protein [Myxococcota bacterium]